MDNTHTKKEPALVFFYDKTLLNGSAMDTIQDAIRHIANCNGGAPSDYALCFGEVTPLQDSVQCIVSVYLVQHGVISRCIWYIVVTNCGYYVAVDEAPPYITYETPLHLYVYGV